MSEYFLFVDLKILSDGEQYQILLSKKHLDIMNERGLLFLRIVER
jgi:hypothetical protein